MELNEGKKKYFCPPKQVDTRWPRMPSPSLFFLMISCVIVGHAEDNTTTQYHSQSMLTNPSPAYSKIVILILKRKLTRS